MRKKLLFFATVAIAALASCSKTEIRPEVESRDVHFVVNTAENEVVKSFIEADSKIDGRYNPMWSKGDKLAIFVGDIKEYGKATGVLENTNPNGTTASFGGVVSGISTKGTFKSFAPASAYALNYSNGNVGIDLAETQKPSSLTIDEACDILVAKETDYLADAEGKVVVDELYFKRMFSIVRVALKGPATLNGEKVQQFSLTAPEGTVLTGRAAIDLSMATIDKWNIKKNTVTATYSTDAPAFGGVEGLENEIWLVVNPCTITSGEKVVLAGETAGYTFSKEVTLPKDLVFPQSQLAVINLTLNDENCTKKAAASWIATDLADITATDEVVITMAKDGAVYAMTSDNGTKNPQAVLVTVKDGELSATPADNLVWNIANDNGNLTIYPKGQTAKWLYTTNSNDGVKVGTNNNKTFIVDSKYGYLKNTKTNRYLGVYNNADWRCYTSTSTNIGGQTLCFYVKGGPIDNTRPTLSVDQNSKVWAADATDAFVVKVTVNSEGGDWTVTPETLSWATVAVDKAAGTITVTPNGANETKTANEATLTVTHASDASLTKEISLKQNAAAATANGGSLERPYTAAEAIAAIDANTDLKGKYVKGIVKEVVSHNSSYGSMVYNIESGEKTLKIFNGYDFGHTKFLGTDDLKVGDEVVVFGDLYKFNTVYELNTDNYLISINDKTEICRGLAVSEPKIAFNVGDTFEFGGKVLQVWRGKEDVDVTASATFSGYDKSKVGKQTITVTVGEETVTYEITVYPAGAALPITITKTMDSIVTENNYTLSSENNIGTKQTTLKIDDVIELSSTGGGNTGSFWGTSPNIDWRCYEATNSVVKISAKAGYIIEKLTLTFKTSNNGTLNEGNVKSGTEYNVNAQSVSYKIGHSKDTKNGQIRITAISVTYKQQ